MAKRYFSINFTKKQRAMRKTMRANPPTKIIDMVNYSTLRIAFKHPAKDTGKFREYATAMAHNKHAREYVDANPEIARYISEVGIDEFINEYNPNHDIMPDNSDDKLIFARELNFYSEFNMAIFNYMHNPLGA